jgi:long-chain acyl-CoA synthetase
LSSPNYLPSLSTVRTIRPWAFDVDGCLISSLATGTLRPLSEQIFYHLHSSGVPLLIWSAGGADYARRVIGATKLGSLVSGWYDKIAGSDGYWRVDVFDSALIPWTFVDDEPWRLPKGLRVLAVPTFIGPRLDDAGLADVLRIVEEEHPTATEA